MDGWSECHSNKISAENVDLGFAILFLAAIFDFLHVAMFSASFVRCIPLFSIKDFPQFLKCVICSMMLMMMMMQYYRTTIDNILSDV